MRLRPVVGLLVVVCLRVGPAAASESLSIEHSPVGCVVAERHFELGARFQPAEGVGRARVYFRASATPDWYYVEMAPQDGR